VDYSQGAGPRVGSPGFAFRQHPIFRRPVFRHPVFFGAPFLGAGAWDWIQFFLVPDLRYFLDLGIQLTPLLVWV
jgi:hypothetical protein